MLGSDLHGSWDISSVPEPQGTGGTGKAQNRNPVAHAEEKPQQPKSRPVVPKRPPNEGSSQSGEPAEVVEERGVAKGNASEFPTPRTPSRDKRVSMGLDGVRMAARRDKTVRGTGTAAPHHTAATGRELLRPTPGCSLRCGQHDVARLPATKKDSLSASVACTGKYTSEPTEPNHRGGYTYPKPMANSARLESPQWRIKSYNKR